MAVLELQEVLGEEDSVVEPVAMFDLDCMVVRAGVRGFGMDFDDAVGEGADEYC